MTDVTLSDEQQRMVDAALGGSNVLVDSVVGSGKTTAIQALCEAWRGTALYLTYNKLLKKQAQERIRKPGVKVTNYHGFVYPYLVALGLGGCGLPQTIPEFNRNFDRIRPMLPKYGLLVIDEYQDVDEDRARLLLNIRDASPGIRIVAVGDMEQRISESTRLDIPAFYKTLLGPDAAQVSFTRTFRMGPDMGRRLSAAWGKPIRGVNEGQRVMFMTPEEAVEHAARLDPGDLMALGTDRGVRTDILNELEKRWPDRYNKSTVYSSTRRDGAEGNGAKGADGVAVFTTFDACKGLERRVCYVCDYTPDMWYVRSRFPDQDQRILRNKFLVAASRGKDEVVFVRRPCSPRARHQYGRQPKGYWDKCRPEDAKLGWIPVRTFIAAATAEASHVYERPFTPEECFDYRIREDVEDAYALLRVDRPWHQGDVVDIGEHDQLIDLSQVIAVWQQIMYFETYDPKRRIRQWALTGGHDDQQAARAEKTLNGRPWHDALILVGLDTQQRRYIDQADQHHIGKAEAAAVAGRLEHHLRRDDPTQIEASLSGRAVDSRTGAGTRVEFDGLADVMHDGVIYALAFAHELTHEMALRLGLQLTMTGVPSGVLWNIRDNAIAVVSVPDRKRFMDAVVSVATRGCYDTFDGELPGLRDMPEAPDA